MKKHNFFNLLYIILIVFPFTLFAQTKTNCDSLYNMDNFRELFMVESMPKVLPSIDSISSKLRYPEEALKHKIEGTVYVKLLVDTTGLPLCPFVILNGLPYGCNEEAIRLVKLMKFIPAYHRRKKAIVSIVLSIKIKLNT